MFIETSVYTNVSRNLPSILNAYRGFFEVSQQLIFCYVVYVVTAQAHCGSNAVFVSAVIIAAHSKKLFWQSASTPCCRLAVWHQLAPPC